MSWRKDLKSKPKVGWFFPLKFGDVVHLIKECNLVDYCDERIKIRMENTEQENKYGYLLVDLFPKEDIAIYSLPDELPAKSCKKFTSEAIMKLAKLQEVNQSGNNKYSYFCAYLEKSNGLRIHITRKDVSVQRAKYRGDMKFSNAFKSKKKKVDEVKLY